MGWHFRKPGKFLRPVLLLLCCEAVGGEEGMALPAAAAVEVFHTWTLIHDDWIDRSALRRGRPTVHELFVGWEKELQMSPREAHHFGGTVAILAGDLLHGLPSSFLHRLHSEKGLPPEIPLTLIHILETEILSHLLIGEMKDVVYSYFPIEVISSQQVRWIMWQKTAALFSYCGLAGALIGLRTTDRNHPLVKALNSFASLSGIAFQIQDDILGLIADEKILGKPVGSDIREGKKTLPLYLAYRVASPAQKRFLSSIVGNQKSGEKEIQSVVELIRELGGISESQKRAERHIQQAYEVLHPLPPSRYKELLHEWASHLLSREF